MGLAAATLAGGTACGRSAESRAAEQAQDACIGSLEPVSEGGTPSPDVLERAVAHAEEAAEADERWEPLRARLLAARARHGTPALERAVDELIDECERVNDIVRSGGKGAPDGRSAVSYRRSPWPWSTRSAGACPESVPS